MPEEERPRIDFGRVTCGAVRRWEQRAGRGLTELAQNGIFFPSLHSLAAFAWEAGLSNADRKKFHDFDHWLETAPPDELSELWEPAEAALIRFFPKRQQEALAQLKRAGEEMREKLTEVLKVPGTGLGA